MSNVEGTIHTEEIKCKKNYLGKLKPSTNQPNIKLYAQVVGTPSSSHHIISEKSASAQTTPNQLNNTTSYNKKKRSPPTPQYNQNPTKKINVTTRGKPNTTS